MKNWNNKYADQGVYKLHVDNEFGEALTLYRNNEYMKNAHGLPAFDVTVHIDGQSYSHHPLTATSLEAAKSEAEAYLSSLYEKHIEQALNRAEHYRKLRDMLNPHHLYLVVAGFSGGGGSQARYHHTMEVIATSEDQAIAGAIERDKADGEFSEDFCYYAYLQPSVLDQK